MPLSIDDSAFPPSAPFLFSALAVGDVYRPEDGSTYFQKMNESSAYDFNACGGVTVAGSLLVQPVSAVLTITAPV